MPSQKNYCRNTLTATCRVCNKDSIEEKNECDRFRKPNGYSTSDNRVVRQEVGTVGVMTICQSEVCGRDLPVRASSSTCTI